MFCVIDKSKIYSYIIAVCTVVVLFVAASNLNDMISPSKHTVEASTNIVGDNIIENLIASE